MILLTREMIMEADNEQLDELVAVHVMGWHKGFSNLKNDKPDLWLSDLGHLLPWIWIDGWSPSKHIGDVWMAEERIFELALVDHYVEHLNHIANMAWDFGVRMPQRWQLAHALPVERCRAALLTKLEADA